MKNYEVVVSTKNGPKTLQLKAADAYQVRWLAERLSPDIRIVSIHEKHS